MSASAGAARPTAGFAGTGAAILYGVSSGARLFCTLAIARPELVKALVLVILTGGKLAAKTLGKQYYLKFAKTAEGPGGMEAVLASPDFAGRAQVNGRVERYLRALPPDRFAAAMRASAQHFADTRDEPALGLRAAALHKLFTPALLIHNWGEKTDGMHTAEVTRTVAAALPNAEPPIVSTEMQVWLTATLKFIEKHST